MVHSVSSLSQQSSIYLQTFQLYDSMICKRERKENTGKKSQKNLWYLFLGTTGQWGCSAILWDGLPVCLSVLLKSQWDEDTDPTTGMKILPAHIPLKPQPPYAHNGTMELTFWAWPQPTAPPDTFPSPAPKNSIKMRSERRGSWVRMRWELRWPP